jgi:hypothetical protein
MKHLSKTITSCTRTKKSAAKDLLDEKKNIFAFFVIFFLTVFAQKYPLERAIYILRPIQQTLMVLFINGEKLSTSNNQVLISVISDHSFFNM